MGKRQLAGVVVALLLARASLAATSLPAFSGQLTGEAPAPAEPLSLWYRQPATLWTSALPLGNGKQGAMVFGGIDSEVICLNESTFWAGGPYTPDNPDAPGALAEVRQLLFDGKWRDAERVASQKMMGKPTGQLPYQPIGDILLSFPKVGTAENYRRDLNLRTATATTTFISEGTTYTRELFTSGPDNVIVMRLTASKPGQIQFKLAMQTPQNVTRSDSPGTQDTFILNGTNRQASGIQGALKFQTRVKILHTGGTLSSSIRPPAPPATAPAGGPGRGRGGGATNNPSVGEYSLTGADSATLLITSATSYKSYNDVTGDPDTQAAALIAKASAKNHDALKKDALADHQALFQRVSLDLGSSDKAKLPTDQRIVNFSKGDDPALASLYFQFGRYLLIGSSRPGGQPANLQGLWNSDANPSWGSKFTININTEMNYWPANNTNLGECVEPLLAMVEDLQVTGGRPRRPCTTPEGGLRITTRTAGVLPPRLTGRNLDSGRWAVHGCATRCGIITHIRRTRRFFSGSILP